MRSPSPDRTCVPTGTCSSLSPPSAPCLRVPRPFSPRPALISRRRRRAERSRSDASAIRMTSPPRPPSPPSGPPLGTNFSRRKLKPPSPPLPAWTRIRAWSLNIGSLLGRFENRHGAALAARPERDRPGAHREDRVVATDLRAGTRAEPGAPLADDDVAWLRELAVEHLHAEVLRVRVATVLRGAEAFLVCHLGVLLLCLQCRLQRRDRALARGVRLLVRERGVEHRVVPRLRAFADLRDGHVLVTARHALDVIVGGRRLLGLRRFGLGRCGGLLGSRLLGTAERDLDAGLRRPEPVVAL